MQSKSEAQSTPKDDATTRPERTRVRTASTSPPSSDSSVVMFPPPDGATGHPPGGATEQGVAGASSQEGSVSPVGRGSAKHSVPAKKVRIDESRPQY